MLLVVVAAFAVRLDLVVAAVVIAALAAVVAYDSYNDNHCSDCCCCSFSRAAFSYCLRCILFLVGHGCC